MYLYYRSEIVTSALMYNCQGSPVTSDVRLYYESLLALRQTKACSGKFSIEQCDGFGATAPPEYAQYLQSLETEYRCSGFCHHTAAKKGEQKGDSKEKADEDSRKKSLAEVGSFLGKSESVEAAALDRTHRESTLPPPLFSQAQFKTSCDGAAARSLTYQAMSMAKVWWYMAIVLLIFSAVLSL